MDDREELRRLLAITEGGQGRGWWKLMRWILRRERMPREEYKRYLRNRSQWATTREASSCRR